VNDCINAEVRDALPDLFHGRLSALDTATMKAHVESCADCRAELELMREVRSSARIAPRIDVAAIAAAIPAYPGASVPAQPARVSIFSRFGALTMTAAAALIAFGGWAISTGSRPDVAPARSASTAAPVVSTAPDIVPSAPQMPAPAVRETEVADLSLVGNTADLTDADLEKLVAELDGMETLPAAEPQSITITDEDIGTENDSTTP